MYRVELSFNQFTATTYLVYSFNPFKNQTVDLKKLIVEASIWDEWRD